MSIADKITSIEGHLTADYEGLENLGADLTNVNKNIQNIRTCLDNIYSSLPKTTGEGSNLSLSPTLKGKLNIEAYKGDTTQEGTPTPSNIEDINVVTGEQEVVVSNKNIFVGYANMEIGWLGSSGAYPTSSSSYPNARYQLIELKPTESITISNSTSQRARVRYIDYALNTIMGTVDGVGESASAYYSSTASFGSGFTNGTITAKQHIYIGILVFEDREDISQTMIEYGSTASSYVEHQEQTKTLHLGDIELAKIGTYQDRIFETSGKNYIDEANEITQGGTVAPADTTRVSIRVAKQLKANTTYTFVTNLPVPSFAYAWVLGTKVSPWSSSQQIYDSGWQTTSQHFTYTTTQDCYVNIPIRKSNNGAIVPSDISSFWFMIYEGAYDSNILYEPYGSGKWYIEKNTDSYIFDGSSDENWSLNSSGTYYKYQWSTALPNKYDVVNTPLYCNYLTQITVAQGNTANIIGICNGLFNGYSIQMIVNISTLEAFKTWLSTEQPVVYYILSTPTYEEITNETLIEELNELEKMMSYNGTTNISISGNLPMILSVSALKGE